MKTYGISEKAKKSSVAYAGRVSKKRERADARIDANAIEHEEDSLPFDGVEDLMITVRQYEEDMSLFISHRNTTDESFIGVTPEHAMEKHD